MFQSRLVSLLLFIVVLGTTLASGYSTSNRVLDGLYNAVLGLLALVMFVILVLRLYWRWGRRVSSRPSMAGASPLTWHEQADFVPVSNRTEDISGYIGYTESFAAYRTTLSFLTALTNEESRITYAGFAFGYLSLRMGEPDGAVSAAECPDVPASASLPAGAILGWLASIHRTYPDNAAADSKFVQSALGRVVADYRNGRSYRLQARYDAVVINTSLAKIGQRSERLDAEKNRHDLPRTESCELIDGAILAGRRAAKQPSQQNMG